MLTPFFAVGCSPATSTTSPPAPADPASRAERTQISGSSAATSPPETVGEEPSAPSPPPAPAPVEPPPREGAPGSTRGTVSCGTTRCTAPGQACFYEEPAWVCRDVEPVDAETAVHLHEDLGLRCDDGLDCPNGETCCTLFGSFERVCVRRAQVGSLCIAEMCMQDGARCPAGRTCSAPAPEYEGVCEAPEGPATCAGRKRCPKDKPICIVTATGLACAARGSPEHDAAPASSRYRCTHQRDCAAGDACQYVFGEIEHDFATYCGPYSRAFMGSVVCEAPSEGCEKGDGLVGQLLPWMGVQ